MNHHIKNTITPFLLIILLWLSLGPEIEGARAVTPEDPIKGEQVTEVQEYIIGAEDVIEVSVWRNDALSKVVSVRPDGKISLPLIGDIQASGLTASQLKDEIAKRLKEFQETPIVSVILKEINSLNIFILGEVARPGQFRLRSNTTLLQAIAIAGGFTQWASKNSIVILRNDPVDGKKRLMIRYDDIVLGRDEKGNILLRPGDTIIVP